MSRRAPVEDATTETSDSDDDDDDDGTSASPQLQQRAAAGGDSNASDEETAESEESYDETAEETEEDDTSVDARTASPVHRGAAAAEPEPEAEADVAPELVALALEALESDDVSPVVRLAFERSAPQARALLLAWRCRARLSDDTRCFVLRRL